MSVGEYGLSVVELHPLPVIILYGLDGRWESTNCLEWNCPSAIYYSIILDLWWESTDCLECNCALCQLLYSMIQTVSGREWTAWSGTVPSVSYLYTL